ncbi:hypothetical protein WCE34_14215 [Luteimonas sp. MJ204]|uniref:hypothetical protein n=1 Tax=Luteimonas sp. MJ145 TaxID=3129234 RepID=UPI0031BA26DA
MVTKAGTAVATLVAAAALTACQVQAKIVSARADTEGATVLVSVEVPAPEAAKIKSRELYTYVRVGDCQDMENGYPAEGYVDGKAVSTFSFATEGATTVFSGRVPTRIFEQYQAPCAALEGGGYFTGILVSDPLVIQVGPGR